MYHLFYLERQFSKAAMSGAFLGGGSSNNYGIFGTRFSSLGDLPVP